MLASRPLISGSRIVTFSISPLMLWEISTGVESLMVGDRIGADILGAKNARLKAALVKTGSSGKAIWNLQLLSQTISSIQSLTSENCSPEKLECHKPSASSSNCRPWRKAITMAFFTSYPAWQPLPPLWCELCFRPRRILWMSPIRKPPR